MRITFLGTGGGRHTTMYQSRSTGGMLVENKGSFLHIDPGPGALTQMNRIRYNLTRTDSLIVSHAHPDHCSDAQSVIEGMTRGGWKRRGHVYGSRTVMDGSNGLGPCISEYHKGIVRSVTTFKPGDILEINGMRTEICHAIHSDPTNVGFKFHTDHGVVSYVSDTEFTEEIARQYIGSRVLILPVTVPRNGRIRYHLCTEDGVEFARIVKPELVIYIHFGIVILAKGPDGEARFAEDETGIRTVASKDLMVVDVDKEITISEAKAFEGEWIPENPL